MKNIIKVPKYRKLKKYTPLHESFFDDDNSTDDVLQMDQDNKDVLSNMDDDMLKDIFKEDINRIDRLCDYYGILDYTYNFSNTEGVSIDINGDINLSNNKWVKMPIKIRKVDGDIILTQNRFTDMSSLPRVITGTLYIDRNYLTDFTGAPSCKRIVATKQYAKTKYPLTDENYKKWEEGTLMESLVYIDRLDAYGELVSLTSTGQYCNVKLYEAEGVYTFKTKDIKYLND